MIGLRGPLVGAEGCCRRCGGHGVRQCSGYVVNAIATFPKVGGAGPLRPQV